MKHKPEIKKSLRDAIIYHMWHGNGFWSAARSVNIRPRLLRQYCKLHKDFYNRLKRVRAGKRK